MKATRKRGEADLCPWRGHSGVVTPWILLLPSEEQPPRTSLGLWGSAGAARAQFCVSWQSQPSRVSHKMSLLPSVLFKCHHFRSLWQVDITGRVSCDLPKVASKNNKVNKNHRREPSRATGGKELLILCEGQGMLIKIPHFGQ